MFSERLSTASLRDPRVARILEAALAAVEPAQLVRRFSETALLPPHSRCFLLGIGKAAEAMTRGAAESITTYESGLVVTKRRALEPIERVRIVEAGHPIPDERSLMAGKAVLEFVQGLEPEDLLVCLISGGGSSLVAAPVDGISLREIQTLSSEALNSGVDIGEVNNLRRCLDRLKGGGLAVATRAQIRALILSDVIGDHLEAVASGPTVPIQPDPARAARLLASLQTGRSGTLTHILDSWSPRNITGSGDRIRNVLIGNARLAAEGASQQAVHEGFETDMLEHAFEGEASRVGQELGHLLTAKTLAGRRPGCTIAVGETTVTLPAEHGTGGRNQELALAAVASLDTLQDCLLVALATDGEDGPTDAAGAVVSGLTAGRATQKGMRPDDYLARHDAYGFFDALGDLLRPGYTGTNVNDIVLMFTL